ncbi:MAG: metallophosphoesterase [Planctomycetia bacterium]|nr:metallophosphoesterase [Planctomycetia bacterium]
MSKESKNVSRRNFLAGAALSVGGVSLMKTDYVLGENAENTENTENTESKKPVNQVKFSVFADFHHHPGVFCSRSAEHMPIIQNRALREKCDLIIHCGDFTHEPHLETEFVNSYNNFQIPSYHTPGNHDFDTCTPEETFHAYRIENGYYSFDRNGFRFIVLDANYFRNEDGTFTHYSKGNYFKYTGNAISNLPPEEVKWLSETLEKSPFPCILFSHQSYEREVGGIANWEEIRTLIDSVNDRHPGRVRLCINGHYHRDHIRILRNVVYFDLNSASFDWVERTHNCYPEELCKEYSLANHTVIYEDPVHAVITMNTDGLIQIDGMESKMLYGITRRDAGLRFADNCGRPVFPQVTSATMIMKYE